MSIAAKIAKLLRLAESSNQHEAALAAARAQELIIKHNVSQEELRRAGGAVQVEPIGEQAIAGYGGRVPRWHTDLAAHMARAFLVQVYYSPGARIWVAGTTTNRETFAATWMFVRSEIQRLADSGWDELPAPLRFEGAARWKRGFCFGANRTVGIRLADAEKRLAAESSTTAIVVADRRAEVDAWMAHREIGAPRKDATPVAASGFREGEKAGWSVPLDKRAGASRALTGGSQ